MTEERRHSEARHNEHTCSECGYQFVREGQPCMRCATLAALLATTPAPTRWSVIYDDSDHYATLVGRGWSVYDNEAKCVVICGQAVTKQAAESLVVYLEEVSK